MPSFIGPEGTSGEVTHHYAEFSLQLDALDLHATQLVLSPRHAWANTLSNGMVLELDVKMCSSVWRDSWLYIPTVCKSRAYDRVKVVRWNMWIYAIATDSP